MVWGIIGALDKEVALIRDSIQVERVENLFGSEWYIGTYRGQKLVVACSGIGKINAAICASTMIREFGAGAVINTGVAGCLTKEIGVLDVVISERATFHDQDMEGLYCRFYPYQKEFIADKGLLDACVRLIEKQDNRNYRYKTGLIVTGDDFIDDRKVKEDIINRLSPLCVEMEGAAIANAAFINKTPFLIIRTMSDNADDSAGMSFDTFLDIAAPVSAGIVLGLIEEYGYH